MSFTIEIKWDSVGLARVITKGKTSMEEIPRKAMQKIGPVARGRARELSNEKSGTFKKNWRYRTQNFGDGGAELSLENTDPKAPSVLFGSREHVIFPRNARALRFETSEGDVVFAKHVTTPAMPGHNVFAILEDDEVFKEDVQSTFDEFMRNLAANLGGTNG